MPTRFDADYKNPNLDFEPLIAEVFDELESNFVEMPRGAGFTDYAVWERGYQVLKRATGGFTNVASDTVRAAVVEAPISFVVFRAILGSGQCQVLAAAQLFFLISRRVDNSVARSIQCSIRSFMRS